MLPLSALGVGIVLVFLAYRYIIYPTLFSSLSKIPNAHFTSSILPWWMQWQRRGGREGTSSIFSAHERLGPIIQLGPKEVSVASLDGLKQIYVGGFAKPKWVAEQFMNYDTPNMISTAGNKEHGERRRMLAHVYSKSYIMNSRDMRVLSTELVFGSYVPILEGAARGKRDLDIYQVNRALGGDFMSAYLFGLANGTNITRNVAERDECFRIHDSLLRDFVEKGEARQKAEANILQFCRAADRLLQQSENDINSPSTGPVVYSHLLSRLPTPPEREKGTVNRALASEMMDHFFTGQEGLRTTLTFLQWELSKTPGLQTRLRNELLTVDLPLQRTSEQLPSFQALDALPLLDAIVQESLRVYPATQAPQLRITPPEGCTIDGVYIPGGVAISTTVFCMHRNEDVFPNASSWEPKRWLKESQDPARLAEMKRWFWAFTSGPRTCTGRHFVTLVMKLLIAEMYTNYTTSIVDDEGMEQKDAFIGHPVGEKLVLKVSAVNDE